MSIPAAGKRMSGSVYCYTALDWQRKGVASIMLARLRDIADASGLPVWIEASEGGSRLYAR